MASALAKLQNYREMAKVPVTRALGAVIGLAGGAASGVVRGMGYENLPGTTNVPTDLVLGAAAIAASIGNVGGRRTSAQALAFGIGMASPGISRLTETAVREWRAK